MSISKITIFQKTIPNGLNLSVYKKLASLKSDFLIMPEFFYADSALENMKEAAEKSKFALDWLLKLNDSYQGVIIGGTIVRSENGSSFTATPIISDGNVVDWYHKRCIPSTETSFISPGAEPGIFMLRGQRFGVLIGEDVKKEEYYKEFADQGVKLIFALMSMSTTLVEENDIDEWEEEFFLKPARDHNLSIIKSCSTGNLFGSSLRGRSMVITPEGISWRVAPMEEGQEILKTIMMPVLN